MVIDKIDWHWDSTEKEYRKNHNITDNSKLTNEQIHQIALLAGNHIGLFLRWIIENNFESSELSNKNDIAKVKCGEMSGTEYLLKYCDAKLYGDDMSNEILPFVKYYYDGNKHSDDYFDDYFGCCINKTDKFCYSVISDETDYQKLKAKIDERYSKFIQT